MTHKPKTSNLKQGHKCQSLVSPRERKKGIFKYTLLVQRVIRDNF